MEPRNPGSATGLGTFAGVFTPSVLTILGLILFLRLGFVVGNVGLGTSLLILLLATAVSVLTSLSLATAASNLRLRGGGVYFLISRTLGIEFGGAVGLVLYTAMSISVAFYCIGFAEAAVALWGLESALMVRAVAAACLIVLLGFAWLGADWATRLQYVVMGLLVVALVSFVVGVVPELSVSATRSNLGRPAAGVGFWTTFAVFFPAVTGFTQGVAMSGDLRNPTRSIVVGTFAAVGVSTVVYAVAMLLLAGAAPPLTLREDTTTIMGDLSLAPWTAQAGVIAATVSSAMASLLGAPRVLQRIAEDRIVPPLQPFAAGAGPMSNPRRATLLSAGIGLVTVAAGDINTVAPVISMFFLASYGLINYASYFEARSAGTSFRPRFRWFDPRLSLAGAVLCALVVVAISPVTGAVAAFVLWGIYTYLQRQEIPERWSDSVRAHHYSEARRHVLALRKEVVSERDWRPCILAFVPNDPGNRARLLEVSTWLDGGAGFTTAVRVIEGSGPIDRRRARSVAQGLERELVAAKLPVFGRTVLAADLRAGVQAIVQSHGLGDVRANTVVFGRPDLTEAGEEGRHRYGEILQECARFSTNVVIVHCDDHAWDGLGATTSAERTISVWWSDDRAGQLMTLLAWLCTRNPEWAQATIEVVVPTGPESSLDPDEVSTTLSNARIKARVVAVDATTDAVRTTQATATMAFVPLRVRRNEPLGPMETPIEQLGAGSPVTVFVLARDELTIDAEPDDGDLARHAQAVEDAAEAWRRAEELDEEASRLLVQAELLRLEVEGAWTNVHALSHRQRVEEAERVEVEAAKAYRRYVELRSRAQERQAQADALDPGVDVELIDPAAWQTVARRSSTNANGSGSGNGNGTGGHRRSATNGDTPA
ncbi:MAG: amino acid permease [Actinomycetota bacterium]